MAEVRLLKNGNRKKTDKTKSLIKPNWSSFFYLLVKFYTDHI